MLSLAAHSFSRAPVQPALAVIVLLSPALLALLFRYVALHAPARSHQIWFSYRQNARLVFFITIWGWWALWDWNRLFLPSFQILPSGHTFADPAIQELIFWLLPLASLSVAQTTAYGTDKLIGQLHWSRAAILRQAFWSVIRFALPLLLISAAFQSIFDGDVSGVVWLPCAFVVAVIGRVFHDKALGISSRLLKSGELRNRAMAMAEKMNVELRRVYIVPQGKGHLLNAFAGFSSISLTDTLSQRLNRAEVDCTIAHELGHLKLGHSHKTILTLILAFAVPGILCFEWPARVPAFRPALDLFVIFAPFLVFYFFSRRFEYQADEEAAAVAPSPEVEISSLTKLYRAAGAPFRANRVTEMFSTHPSLIHRVRSIARTNGVPDTRVAEILLDTEPQTKDRAKIFDTRSA